MRALLASAVLALGACTGFEDLAVGADQHDANTNAARPDAALPFDVGVDTPPPSVDDAAFAPPTHADDSAQVEPPVDAAATGASDSGAEAGVEEQDSGKTCCQRWEEFLGGPPLQPCAELRCTSVLPPPPRLPTLLDAGLVPPLFDGGFP